MSSSHTVMRTVPVSVEHAFDVVVAEDVLPRVLHRVGPIPGVRVTRDLTGPWDAPGSSRTVVLEDGNTARETVLAFERPERFVYRVECLTGVFGRLVDHAIGAWTFAGDGEGSSRFEWTYTFHGRGRVSAALLALVTGTVWARYMSACADSCVARAVALADVEAG